MGGFTVRIKYGKDKKYQYVDIVTSKRVPGCPYPKVKVAGIGQSKRRRT